MGGMGFLTLSNGFLPLAVLLVLAAGMPAVIAGQTLSQVRLAVGVILTAAALWAVGAAILAFQYSRANGALTETVWVYFRRSALLGLLWGPVLAVVWLMRAQGVEKRRGLLMRDHGERE